MEDWMAALRSVQNPVHMESTQYSVDHFSGMHNWYACSHARPTYCNVCREALSGVTSHGLSCEVCKFKAHKRCAVRATNNCKWTTLASIGHDIIEDEDGSACYRASLTSGVMSRLLSGAAALRLAAVRSAWAGRARSSQRRPGDLQP
ncbi:hypothetical protein CRUP_029408, partial [Coryphaenoides rupestris]